MRPEGILGEVSSIIYLQTQHFITMRLSKSCVCCEEESIPMYHQILHLSANQLDLLLLNLLRLIPGLVFTTSTSFLIHGYLLLESLVTDHVKIRNGSCPRLKGREKLISILEPCIYCCSAHTRTNNYASLYLNAQLSSNAQ